MNARKKFNNLMGKAMGVVSYVLDAGKKSLESSSTASSSRAMRGERVNPNEMIRVTDSRGNEYLCPIGKLKDANFVAEREKSYCHDYTEITRHSV